ncbi:MAG: FAD-dependent oxidoreductase [Prevotella sp.]|nr:FAD-dependent oxidoreductase [Prevotella sp.]
MRKLCVFLFSWLMLLQGTSADMKEKEADVCIYGATSAGVIAAYTAKIQGKSVLLIEPTARIGGLSAGGLGDTDIGKVDIIQGFSLGFYKRVGRKYGKDEPAFKFEPSVALAVYNDFLSEAVVEPLMPYRLRSVKKKGNVINSIVVEKSDDTKERVRISAKVFIDCSYEGDLMAKSGVSYTVGRESNAQYGEIYDGVQMLDKHQFPDGIDPYKVKGDPKSGLLYGILKRNMGKRGDADKCVQAYNYRITLTNDPSNMLPITKPENYDPTRYELLLRWKELAPWNSIRDCFGWNLMPNNKTDINNRGAFSTDMIGENWDYPEASYKKRDKIRKAHLDYTLGLLYFVGHDERVPDSIRNSMLEWGLPKDEYQETAHFTPQMYIREARRMIGRYVMTENNCLGRTDVDDYVGWAAYNMDSHNCGRYVVDGMVKNEGDVQIGCPKPYNVSYRSITPVEAEASNLLVPVCLSASHIAYGSIRMEPVFMVLGESAAIAACLAIDNHQNCVQKVSSTDVMQKFNALKP